MSVRNVEGTYTEFIIVEYLRYDFYFFIFLFFIFQKEEVISNPKVVNGKTFNCEGMIDYRRWY